jgi:hypothetical protein
LRTAARIWTSATRRSKARDISRWPSSFIQCIFVSARLRRWYPLHFRQMARPRYLDARRPISPISRSSAGAGSISAPSSTITAATSLPGSSAPR